MQDLSFLKVYYLKRIFFTVTNDLTYDQRMHRICTTLVENGYEVTLVGRKLTSSLPLTEEIFFQKRLRCWFNKGKKFYAEYNIRLFLFLFLKKMDAICAIDLDTILPCLKISQWKKIPRIYDAHELFTGLKEVVTRPAILKAWRRIENKTVPAFQWGYTVSDSIAEEFYSRYKVKYQTIRNIPLLKPLLNKTAGERTILYQGAVNEGRGFEWLIPAMQWVNCRLIICGDGNFMTALEKLIIEYKLEQKIELKGMLSPDKLWEISQQAYIGVDMLENAGVNQYLALPNKFFDYIHAGLPQVTVSYPEYRKLNQTYKVAVLLEELDPEKIAEALNNLLVNDVLYNELRENCLKARETLTWQQEEKKLIQFYQSVFTK